MASVTCARSAEPRRNARSSEHSGACLVPEPGTNLPGARSWDHAKERRAGYVDLLSRCQLGHGDRLRRGSHDDAKRAGEAVPRRLKPKGTASRGRPVGGLVVFSGPNASRTEFVARAFKRALKS